MQRWQAVVAGVKLVQPQPCVLRGIVGVGQFGVGNGGGKQHKHQSRNHGAALEGTAQTQHLAGVATEKGMRYEGKKGHIPKQPMRVKGNGLVDKGAWQWPRWRQWQRGGEGVQHANAAPTQQQLPTPLWHVVHRRGGVWWGFRCNKVIGSCPTSPDTGDAKQYQQCCQTVLVWRAVLFSNKPTMCVATDQTSVL